MVKSLRNGHLQIWRTWAFLLPIGIISAWLSIPVEQKQALLQPTEEKALPVIFSKQEKEDYAVLLRGTADTTTLQLEWINKSALTFPSATVYKTVRNSHRIDNASLVGRIEARGTYRFALDSSFKPSNIPNYHLVLYDFIHGQEIDVINF